MFYAVLWYAMVWYDEWESMRLYAIVWYFIAMVWDSNAMLWYLNATCSYAMVHVVKNMLELTVYWECLSFTLF